jgi:hypothetical protein
MLNINIRVSVDDIVDGAVHNMADEDVINMIHQIDEGVADVDFTINLLTKILESFEGEHVTDDQKKKLKKAFDKCYKSFRKPDVF